MSLLKCHCFHEPSLGWNWLLPLHCPLAIFSLICAAAGCVCVCLTHVKCLKVKIMSIFLTPQKALAMQMLNKQAWFIQSSKNWIPICCQVLSGPVSGCTDHSILFAVLFQMLAKEKNRKRRRKTEWGPACQALRKTAFLAGTSASWRSSSRRARCGCNWVWPGRRRPGSYTGRQPGWVGWSVHLVAGGQVQLYGSSCLLDGCPFALFLGLSAFQPELRIEGLLGRLVSALESRCPAAEPWAAWLAGCVWALGCPKQDWHFENSARHPGTREYQSLRNPRNHFTCEDEGLWNIIERFLLSGWFLFFVFFFWFWVRLCELGNGLNFLNLTFLFEMGPLIVFSSPWCKHYRGR